MVAAVQGKSQSADGYETSRETVKEGSMIDDYRNIDKPVIKDPARREKVRAAFVGAMIICAFGFAGSVEFNSIQATKTAEQNEQRVVVVEEALSVAEVQLAEFFERQGSPAPVEMGKAVAKRKRPRLLAAVAAVESNGNPAAVGKAGEVTAWQIIEKEWGSAGVTTEAHSKKAEDILEELIRQNNGNLRAALSAYNGDRSGRYAAKVMKKVSEVM